MKGNNKEWKHLKFMLSHKDLFCGLLPHCSYLYSDVNLLACCRFGRAGLVWQQWSGQGVVLVIVRMSPGGIPQHGLLMVGGFISCIHSCSGCGPHHCSWVVDVIFQAGLNEKQIPPHVKIPKFAAEILIDQKK